MDANIKLATKHLENAQNSAIRMLAEFIQEHDGVINLSNAKGENDNVYAYIWLGDLDQAVDERRADCIYYDEKYDTIYIHAPEGYDDPSYEDFEDIKDDHDNWYPLTNSETLVVPTLYSVLEAIEEYVE